MHQIKLLLSVFCLLFIFQHASAQEKKYRFHKVFFYSFTKYIEWPESHKQGDFKIAVVGQSEIIPLLEEMAEIKKVGKRTIKIIQIDGVKGGEKYNMIFIPNEQSAAFANIKSVIGKEPTLLITEASGMAAKGAMINFKDVEGKLRFEVNTEIVEQSGLKMSQELIRFGEEIK